MAKFFRPAATKGFSPLNPTELNDTDVRTIGLFGDGEEAEKWLVKTAVLEESKSRGQLAKLKPGIHCFAKAGEDADSNIQFLYLQHAPGAFKHACGAEKKVKDFTRNMFRCLVELSEEVLLFFGEDDVRSFRPNDTVTKAKSERFTLSKIRMSEPLKEDVRFQSGFDVGDLAAQLSRITESARGADVNGLELGNSLQFNALHFPGGKVQDNTRATLKFASRTEIHDFFEDAKETCSITFGEGVKPQDLLKLLALSSTAGEDEISRMNKEIAKLANATIALPIDHQQRLEDVLAAFITERFPLAKLFLPACFPTTSTNPPDDEESPPSAKKCSFCKVYAALTCSIICQGSQRVICLACRKKHAASDPQTGRTPDETAEDFFIQCPSCGTCHAGRKSRPSPPRPCVQSFIASFGNMDAAAHVLLTHPETPKQKYSLRYVTSLLQRIHPQKYTTTHSDPYKIFDRLLRKQAAQLQAVEKELYHSDKADEQWPVMSFRKTATSAGVTSPASGVGLQGRVKHAAKGFTILPKTTSTFQAMGEWFERHDPRKPGKSSKQTLEEAKTAFLQPAVQEVLRDKGCIEAVQSVWQIMLRLLIDETSPTSSDAARSKKLLQAAITEKIEKETASRFRASLAHCQCISEPTRLIINRLHFGDSDDGSQKSFSANDPMLRFVFQKSSRRPVQHLLSTEVGAVNGSSQQVMKLVRQGKFQLDSDTQRVLRTYRLKDRAVLLVLQDKRTKKVTVHVLRNQHPGDPSLPKPCLVFPDQLDLVDFDEEDHFLTFYSADTRQVKEYQFANNLHGKPKCRWTTALPGNYEVCHMLHIPGRKCVALLSKDKVCSLLNAEDGHLMKSFLLNVPDVQIMRNAVVTPEGLFLCIFMCDAKAVSAKQGTMDDDSTEHGCATLNRGSHKNMPAGGQSSPSNPQTGTGLEQVALLTVQIFSLKNLENIMKIRSTELRKSDWSGQDLIGVQLSMVGKQPYVLTLANKQGKKTLSLWPVEIETGKSHLRIERKNTGATNDEPEDGDQQSPSVPSNYLDYIYLAYDRFCTEDCLKTSRQKLHFTCVLPTDDHLQMFQKEQRCERYINNLFERLFKKTKKPHSQLFTWNLRSTSLCASSGQHVTTILTSAAARPLGDWLLCIICLIPLQIALAENSHLMLVSNGHEKIKPTDSELEDGSETDSLAASIRFGLFDDLLQSCKMPVKVVTSMGKQSTGKSFMLNHLTGSMFDIAGGRCTEGAWMTLRFTPDCLYVVLDFEGIGSKERAREEDTLLSLLNASVSGLTLFKVDHRFDEDLLKLFQSFHEGVNHIKDDDQLFKGIFCMVIRDVPDRDVYEIQQEFEEKLYANCEMEEADNFVTRMYNENVAMAPFPLLEDPQFYSELDKLHSYLTDDTEPIACSGPEFKKILKYVMAIIANRDFASSLNRGLTRMELDDLQQKFSDAIANGEVIGNDGQASPLPILGEEQIREREISVSTTEGPLQVELPDFGLSLMNSSRNRRSKEDLVQPLVEVFSKLKGRDVDSADWKTQFCAFLNKVCKRRQQRVLQWFCCSTSKFPEKDVSSRRATLQNALSNLDENWTECGSQCDKCLRACLLFKHSSKEPHNCLHNHLCQKECDFCRKEVEQARSHKATGPKPAQLSQCSKKACHDGCHECVRKPPHTCGAKCGFSENCGCTRKCRQHPSHEGDHLCLTEHDCPEPCGAAGCEMRCSSKMEDHHTVHKCSEERCTKRCMMKNCTSRCSKGHFHGHGQPNPAWHMCNNEHQCPILCQKEGICHVKRLREVVERQFRTGAGETFSYEEYTSDVAERHQCIVSLKPGQVRHEGLHSCGEVHRCSVQCPTCRNFCDHEFGHFNPDGSSLHKTIHGNMVGTRLVSEKEIFTVHDSENDCKITFKPGDDGKALTCRRQCDWLGQGHCHILYCKGDDREDMGATERRLRTKGIWRHETTSYLPEPDEPKDELTCEAYWKAIGFCNPCTKERQAKFKECGAKCLADTHVAQNDTLFCTEKMWHEPLQPHQLEDLFQGHGYIHSSGHHFQCNEHGRALHHVLIVDRSFSMGSNDVLPTRHDLLATHANRLGAVMEATHSYMVIRKQRAVADNDRVSLIYFNDKADSLFELEQLMPDELLQRMISSPHLTPEEGTNFSLVRLSNFIRVLVQLLGFLWAILDSFCLIFRFSLDQHQQAIFLEINLSISWSFKNSLRKTMAILIKMFSLKSYLLVQREGVRFEKFVSETVEVFFFFF